MIQTTVPRLLCLTLAIALAIGCVSSGPRPPAEPEVQWIGVSGDHVLAFDATQDAVATLVSTSDELRDVGALTYDRSTRTLYAVTDHTRMPRLVALDRETGVATVVGPIVIPGDRARLSRVEGLAFNAEDGRLYAAGGTSSFASNRLLMVDPATGKARELARVQGTLQNEIDAMTFAGGELYATDGVAGATALYQIDLETGEATAQGEQFPQNPTDLGFHPDARRLLGTLALRRELVVLTLGGEATELGPTHGELDFGGVPMSALAFTGTPGSSLLFNDGFESGDLSAWRKGKKRHR